ncbi:hypothetical protein [Spongiactinospora sp. TRM90649]|uniref:hypothetical protein n=1 Tax=Spongiactinospora sp. TRM90649 TaxID=3031114 RepID=UPI0023F9D78C|nr:hypothetical protein [Spongiactinospora sp. TRM90649]MDF5755744.1 hypothetical protein [Spongiactinospora sp. TRM90649]
MPDGGDDPVAGARSGPLREAVEADGPLGDDALERLAVATLTALASLAQAGLSHRGLSPGNVLLGPDGPRLCDPGVEPGEGGSWAAHAYRSPKQILGLPSWPPGDLFSWAATMAYAAMGEPPSADAPADLTSIAPPLRDVLGACLAESPAARPAPQDTLLHLLGTPARTTPTWGAPVAPYEGARAVPASSPAAREGAVRRFPVGVVAAVGVVVVLAGGGVWAAASYSGRPVSKVAAVVSASAADSRTWTVSDTPIPAGDPARGVFAYRSGVTWLPHLPFLLGGGRAGQGRPTDTAPPLTGPAGIPSCCGTAWAGGRVRWRGTAKGFAR